MRHLLLLACLILTSVQAAESVPVAPVVAWDLAQMEAVRERVRAGDAQLTPAVERLVRDAERAIQGALVAVTDKAADAPAPSGDAHDFVSFSTYHWPDPADPKAPWIWKDGEFNQSMIDRYDLPRLRKMAARVTDGTLAWWFTGERRYAEVAVQQLQMWFIAEATRMNPHLEYGQFIPNKDDNRGHAYGIIDTRDFAIMLSAVALLERENFIPASDRIALRAWFRSYLDWLTTSRLGQSEAKATNNHGIFYDQQVIAYAAYIGDTERLRAVIAHFAQERLARQIEPDGSMPRELARADAAIYSTFNLTSMVQVLVMSHACGNDLWSWSTEDGRSLRKAVQWFGPFLDGKTWTWSGTFKPQRLTAALVMAASITGDPELIAQAKIRATDPAARNTLLFPLPVAKP